MSSTRAPRISNSICSPRMTGTSSTTPSPPTWRSPCSPCMTSSAAAALRRRPSPNSRANSRSRSSPRSTTEPTAPGSSSACSRTTSPAASSSIPASSPAVAPASAPTCTSCGACAPCASRSLPAPVGWRASAGATCFASPSTRPPRPSTRDWSNALPPDLLRKSPGEHVSRSCCAFESHAVPLLLQQGDGSPSDALRVSAIEVICAKLLVCGAPREEVVRGNQHRMGDSEHRFLVPAMTHDATVARCERAVGCPNRSQRGFGKGSTQPTISAASFSRLMFPGTLIVAWAEPGPAGQVAVTREVSHVDPQFGDQHLGGPPGDTVDCIEPREFISERGDDLLDALTQGGDRLVHVVQVSQELADEERV